MLRIKKTTIALKLILLAPEVISDQFDNCAVTAVRKEYARRSHEASEGWKQRMQRAEMTLEENDQTYRAVGAGICTYLVSIISVQLISRLSVEASY